MLKRQHLTQTAEGEGGKSQLVLRQESELKHPGEPQACISEKTTESDSSFFIFSPITECNNRIHIEKLQ